MSDPHAMQRLCGLMRKAVQDYEMISPGDKIMVGVSGGKDSVALTIGLAQLRRYLGFDYEVVAVTLDPQFDHQAVDYSPLAALFARYGVPYEVRRTEIGPIVFEYRQEKNPCSLCARLRRGALHTAAQELGCNKVALGHHLDDAVETFYMNLWREGRIGCFSPVTYLSQRDLTLIRPMLLATEYEVQCAVREEGLPIVKSICPADGVEAEAAVKAAYEYQGPVYLRMGRLAVPVFHEDGFKFKIGKGEIMREGTDIAIIANGLMTYEAIKAGEALEAMGIHARIVNMSTIKPLDEELVLKCAKECGKIITCEEHSIIGGLGEAVCSYLAETCPVPVKRIGVNDRFGCSGTAAEVLKAYGLSAEHIVEVTKAFLNR